MRKPLWFGYWISLCLFIACGRVPEGTSDESTTLLHLDIPTYQIKQEILVGKVTHIIHSVEALARISADKTLDPFKMIAKDMPAEPGRMWYHVKGSIQNRGLDSSSVNVTSVVMLDIQRREYQANTKTVKFIPDEKMLTSIPIRAGETVDWEAYFSVPKDIPPKDLRLKVTDLTFLMEEIALVKF